MRLSHKRNAIADRERYFVLAISDVNEKVGAGIVIEFEEAVTSLILNFTQTPSSLLGSSAFSLANSSSSKVIGALVPIR